jgi:acyl-CoA reductase-like NAD-dependent aldehyde dehydrogenase
LLRLARSDSLDPFAPLLSIPRFTPPLRSLRSLARRSVVNPSTGESITAIPEGLPADVEVAIDAAHKAFNTTWGTNCPGFERGKYLIKIAELMERDLDILASIEALDNGKTYAVAKSFDVGRAACTRTQCHADSPSR